MRLRPAHVASVILSGLMTTTVWAGLHQPTQAKDASQPSTLPAQAPSAPQPTSSQLTLASANLRPTATKHKKSTVEPIEPFIKADVVALGQWLMTKTVKNLVAVPQTKPAAKTSQQPAQPSTPKQEKPPRAKAAAQRSQPSAADPQAAPPQLTALPPEPSDSPTIDSYTEMRVALTKQAPSVSVASSAGGAVVSAEGDLVTQVAANVGYQVSADDRGLFLNGEPIPTAVWLESENGYLAVGNRWYRGRLLLIWQNGGVMTVNHVLLRDYLYSVVGAEMSASWNLEALKAQAVAARSYAIVHTVRHQRRIYDLDDTQRYQAYKGIATEASSTHQAVHDTAGEFISYDDGIVESLYAANQDIVDDAHSGYGMSQVGALDLAKQGYRYYEILSVYYPETSVGRIDIGE